MMETKKLTGLPDYSNCLVNLSNSILKEFGAETAAATLPQASFCEPPQGFPKANIHLHTFCGHNQGMGDCILVSFLRSWRYGVWSPP